MIDGKLSAGRDQQWISHDDVTENKQDRIVIFVINRYLIVPQIAKNVSFFFYL